ncbi:MULTISPECIES: FeoA family protein [Desulfosporosinus]|uniref:Ferrous iron transport protein A n=1 Tax=Desulfosporosinus nitroreducens TaxID=2018668 RepID=A0ABT8QJR2_9FIRM|nr:MULTISPECIES: FeoA family protein [Desulfosporosinus]MCO1600460.1 ferrous iron transport protein A [Desulfosporosinus nitroreducens]MCO5386823.1 ferrous iron transport protein A [Desulfosporosinus sp.]MDA8221680.1 FeoA family protein [Desulfitobacterium hafniense]MDO0821548.1 ferrous iron transport protein A [Desulfosporosinus nitroreducens]
MDRFLQDLKPGERARVERIEGGGALRRRMMDMGIVPGVELEVVRCAPLGGPLQIRLKGYYLAMRRGECARIMVCAPNREYSEPSLASR